MDAEQRLELRNAVGPLRANAGIHWDAPIVMVITYHDKEGDQKEACGMSLYIDDNSPYIKQLQGGKSVTFRADSRSGPSCF
jgi:hypothetical protein